MTTASERRARQKLRDRDNGVTPIDRAGKKSTNPKAIRTRLRRKADSLEEDYELLQEVTMAKFKPIEEWTLEELANGKPRNENGNFQGPKPRWLTPLIREEVQRRLREETLLQFNVEAGHAVKVLAAFLSDDEEPRLRFDAARLILEYVIGKPEQKVNLNASVQLQSMLASALVLPDGADAHPIIDGQFAEEPEKDDDD